MATIITSLKNWKAGQQSQIKTIREVIAQSSIGDELAKVFTELLQGKRSSWSKKDVYSWNASLQRECKAQIKASKDDTRPIYALTFDADKNLVTFGLATAQRDTKKDEFYAAVAKFVASDASTKGNKKIVMRLFTTMMKADA